MELIDKAAVVAEIERRLHKYEKKYEELARYEIWITAKKIEPKIEELKSLRNFLNSLEVKEVDLEEKIVDYINSHFHIRYDETLERGNDPLTTMDFEEIAKYFFELGIKSSKEE